jgi:glutamate racemase
VIGVVDPGARAAVRATEQRAIGVIGTRGTITSGAYERAIRALDPSVRIAAKACPLFVPLVEEGWVDTEPARLIAREYLTPLTRAHVDTLVLGCTHYPLLKPLLAAVMGADVRLIDSAAETAAEVARTITTLGLRTTRAAGVSYRFIASDAPQQFLQLGQRFLGEAIDHVETLPLG